MSHQLRTIFIVVLIFTLVACVHQDGDEATEIPAVGSEVLDPSSDGPNEGTGIKGMAWVDFDSTKIVVKESYPMQVEIIVYGDMPSPCHEIRWEVGDPDENKVIHVTVYSEIDPSETCAQLLEPFDQVIPLGDFEDTGYRIWINDYEVGGF
jgi:hypothetical protein